MSTGNTSRAMHGTHTIRVVSLALAAAAALPPVAFAEREGSSNPQEQARIERLVRQALQSQQAARPAEMAEAGRTPLACVGSPGR